MEKNKNRSDLLAAGRKKLQQFRKKKDNKGTSHGKLSHKTSVSEPEGAADSAPIDHLVLPNVIEGETVPASTSALPADLATVDSTEGETLPTTPVDFPSAVLSTSPVMESVPAVDAESVLVDAPISPAVIALDADVASAVDSSVWPVTPNFVAREETLPAVDAGMAPVDSVPSIGANAAERDAELVSIESLTSREASEVGLTPVEMEGANEEEKISSNLREDFPYTPAVQLQDRGMESGTTLNQEADQIGSEQCNGSGEDQEPVQVGESSGAENQRDDRLSVSEHGESDKHVSPNARDGNGIKELISCFSPGPDELAHDAEGAHGIEHEDTLKPEWEGEGLNPYGEVTLETLSYGEVTLETLSSSQGITNEREDGYQEHTEVDERLHEEVYSYKLQHMPGGAVTIESKSTGEFLKAGQVSQAVSLKPRESASVVNLREMDHRVLLEGGFADGLESLKQQLYLLSVVKDFLHLQLAEQIELQIDIDRQDQKLLDEVSNLHALVKETQESNTVIGEDLGHCRSELQAMVARKEELEIQRLSASEEIEKLSAKACELQEKLEQSGELTHLHAELADCKGLLGALQMENANLTGDLISAAEERKKLEEEKNYFVNENTVLAAELFDHKKSFVTMNDKQLQLEADLKESMLCLEKLTEENSYLLSCLDIHKAKIQEINGGYQQLFAQAGEAGNQLESSNVQGMVAHNAIDGYHPIHEKHNREIVSVTGEESAELGCSWGLSIQQLEGKDFEDSVGAVALKAHLEEVEKIVQNLEKAIQGMHSHSASLSRPGGKAITSGVSKLIQAFESKVHHDEPVSDELPSVETEHSSNLFKLAREQVCHLRAKLKQLDLDAKKAKELFGEARDDKRNATMALRELEFECNAQRQQNNTLEAKADELVKKLSKYRLRMDDMQTQLCELQRNSDDMVGPILNQVEFLQKEVAGKITILEQERNSMISAVSKAAKKLDGSIGVPVVSPASTDYDISDVGAWFATSVNAAMRAIEGLHEKLKTAYLAHENISKLCEELNQKVVGMHERNDLVIVILGKINSSLRELVNGYTNVEESMLDLKSEEVLDLLPSDCETLIKHLQQLLDDRLHLQSAKCELDSELMNRTQGIEELNKRCLDLFRKLEEHEIRAHSEGIPKLVEGVNKPEDMAIYWNNLEASVALLLEKYKEAIEQVSLSKDYLLEITARQDRSTDDWMFPLYTLLKEEFGSKVLELSELRDEVHHLSSLILQKEDEMHGLKESLSKMEEAVEVAHSELHAKGTELEQSEQRLSSVREKLSIAVAKGKGLIVQRDGLKQCLAEKSSELDKCLQELESKDSALHDTEAKLKVYSEAGERVEALESELSYIRNSATALRESFFLKDSALQRIEEILEDLELPEHFHSRDIIEKIEWLARSVAGNSLPLPDWEQKSSVGGSYSDSGFVVMDAWKDDLQISSNPGYNDLRRKYEELQGKFYGLAEQNDMLEQSLVERNNLVQRWEEVLDRIDMPLHLRSMEPEDRIEWLGRKLSEAHHDIDSLRMKIDNLEISSDSLMTDLEESRKKISDLEVAVAGFTIEKGLLSESLEKLMHEHEKVSEKAVQDELDKDNLHKEIADLQEKLVEKLENKEHQHNIEIEIKKLEGLVNDALPDHGMEDTVFDGCKIECLEASLRKLIENYMALSLEKSMHTGTEDCISEEVNEIHEDQRMNYALDAKERDLVDLKEELDQPLSNVALLNEEKDTTMKKYQSLITEIEAVSKQRDILQEQLTIEEQKTASTREKLNVAVRKGKGLVQQRDSLKKTIEEMKTEMDRLKIELTQRENALEQYVQKVRVLSAYPEKLEILESENFSLRNCLSETEQNLQESGRTLNGLLSALHAIEVAGEVSTVDPMQKMEGIGKLTRDLRASVISSEQEAKKSKRAAELLLAELNEVQERADSLQEELADAESALAELSKQRDIAEAAKIEALSQLEQSKTFSLEERKNQLSEVMELKAGIDQLRKECFSFVNLLASAFSKDLELLGVVEAGMKSLLKQFGGTDAVGLPLPSGGVLSINPVNEVIFPASSTVSELSIDENFGENAVTKLCGLVDHGVQECIRGIDGLKEKIQKHSIDFGQQATHLSKTMLSFKKGIAFQKESSESLERDISRLQIMKMEKDTEINVLCRNLALLYEACASSILEIEGRKAHMIGNSLISRVQALGKTGTTLKLPTCIDGQEPGDGQSFTFSEECIRTMADTLLMAVKGSANVEAEMVEANQRELKAAILQLQNELQEKDIQRNRICAELVTQIREAEASANNYSVDLASAKKQVLNLEKRVEELENERNLLESRVNELTDQEAFSKDLLDRIRSLTDMLTSKEQEIESLMQALDEEDSQMEVLENRIQELEKVVQQKNLAVEGLEASRGKAMAKLSTTVSKFDELHRLSESLLSEVENLQTKLQVRDEEISFLRQEVTRCTHDVLASQESTKRNSTDVHGLLTWLEMMVSRFGGHDVHLDDSKHSKIHAYAEILEKHFTSVVSELDDLRVVAQSRDSLLQAERSRVEELLHKDEILENSLREKESQLELFQATRDSGQPAKMNSSEILEVEPMINKRAVNHVRSVHKVTNDQVAIGIDMEPDNNIIDEDEDKGHRFKSLTTSKIIPRITRPMADRIDGIWVSGGRMLMRQPTLRLGVVVYWFVLHLLLANTII